MSLWVMSYIWLSVEPTLEATMFCVSYRHTLSEISGAESGLSGVPRLRTFYFRRFNVRTWAPRDSIHQHPYDYMDTSDDNLLAASPSGERLSKRRKTSNTTVHPAREMGLMRSVPGDNLSSFVGSSSGIYFIRSVYGAIRNAQSNSAPIQTPESDIVPGEDDHLPSAAPDASKRIWRDDEIETKGLFTSTFQELLAWSESYFTNWHPAYPFLHAPAVLESFEKVARHGIPKRQLSQDFDLIIARSIMSISLADRRQEKDSNRRPYPADLVFQSYQEAIDILQRALSRAASIQSLQAAIGVQLFLVSMLRLNAASRLGGLIIRMALQLGLHRCATRYPSFTSAERELRQRIFWSLYCIDRFICSSTGLPLSLRDDDIDVCYPSQERHAETTATSATVVDSHQKADDRLRLLEFLARHSQIRGDIMEFRNKCMLHAQKETDVSFGVKVPE